MGVKKDDIWVIKEILSDLPKKVVAPNGKIYYLKLEIDLTEVNGNSFLVYYAHPEHVDKVGLEVFQVEEKNTLVVKDKLFKVLENLNNLGFRKFKVNDISESDGYEK